MPNCFQMIDRTTDQPVAFVEIDRLMCEHFGVKCDPVKWHHEWYTFAQWYMAAGKQFDQIDRVESDPHWNEILDWLGERYKVDAWAEVGRR